MMCWYRCTLKSLVADHVEVVHGLDYDIGLDDHTWIRVASGVKRRVLDAFAVGRIVRCDAFE